MLGITHIYFLGIGGIGMSALARYCRAKGYTVAGYDRTVSPLTKELETEGIAVCYSEDLADVRGLRKDATLVVRTPAVPDDEAHYVWFREQGFDIVKRAELLGRVTCKERALCVAGTHGKTTTSTMLAHLLASSHIGTNAFLGGISNNYASNLLLNTSSDLVVVEADEYDRSFHHLRPYMSVITSIDPDHLDIYGSSAAYQEGFDVYAGLVEDTIVLKQGYELDRSRVKAKIYTYSATDKADFYASNIRVADGSIMFDLVARGEVIKDLLLGVPVWVNIENSVAASALALLNGVTEDELRAGLAGYKGVYTSHGRCSDPAARWRRRQCGSVRWYAIGLHSRRGYSCTTLGSGRCSLAMQIRWRTCFGRVSVLSPWHSAPNLRRWAVGSR